MIRQALAEIEAETGQTPSSPPEELETTAEARVPGEGLPDTFAPSALPDDWGKAKGDSPTDADLVAMTMAGDWDKAKEEEDTFVGEMPPPAPPEEPGAEAGLWGPGEGAEADEDRLAVLRHRLGIVEEYLKKSAEDHASGVISEEMWREETERWTFERDKLKLEIASAEGPAKAA